jgi:hypothetical protein
MFFIFVHVDAIAAAARFVAWTDIGTSSAMLRIRFYVHALSFTTNFIVVARIAASVTILRRFGRNYTFAVATRSGIRTEVAAPSAMRWIRICINAVSLATGFVVVATVPALAAIFTVAVEVCASVIADPVVYIRAVAGAVNTVLFWSALVEALTAMVQVCIQESAIETARCGLFLDTLALAVGAPLRRSAYVVAFPAMFFVGFYIDASIVSTTD